MFKFNNIIEKDASLPPDFVPPGLNMKYYDENGNEIETIIGNSLKKIYGKEEVISDLIIEGKKDK